MKFDKYIYFLIFIRDSKSLFSFRGIKKQYK